MAVNLIAQTAYFHYLYCIQTTISQTNKPTIMEIENFMSEYIDQITTALSAFQGEIEQPSLNKVNPYFKSRYVDLSGVLKVVQPVLAKNGLCVAQIIQGDNLVTLLSHKSGQWFKSIFPMGPSKSLQDRGSAITYAKRYAICAMLGISADTDDDGNSATDSDKKQGGIKTTQQTDATDDAYQQAVKEITGAKSLDDFRNTWADLSARYPKMCANTGSLYAVAVKKDKELKEAGK